MSSNIPQVAIVIMTILIALFLSSLYAGELCGVPAQTILDLVWQGSLLPIAHFVDDHLSTLISWPVAIVVTAVIILRSALFRQVALSTASRIKSVDVFGFSLELNEQMKELRRESDDLIRIIPAARDNISKDAATKVESMKIDEAFVGVVESIATDISKSKKDFSPKNCRATIHLESPLFTGELMQLLEYVSGEGKRLPGRNAGRTFSIRRGIIGRVWRSHIPEIAGLLPNDTETQKDDDRIKHIAQIWGLTQTEAKHVQKYPSYICIPFSYGKKTAVFYMDSTKENAFLPQKQNGDALTKIIKSTISDSKISSAIGDIDRVLGFRGSPIEVVEKLGEQ